MPVDLLYLCFARDLRGMLEELAKTFTFDNVGYIKNEPLRLFKALTRPRRECGVTIPRLNCLKFLYPVDVDNYLMKHDDTFEGLCDAYLGHDGGEEAILDYLNRGGKCSFTFSIDQSALLVACDKGSLQLVEKLLDLGANPDKFIEPGTEYENYGSVAMWSYHPGDQVAILHLLLQRGANPFKMDGEDPGLGFPFDACLEADGERDEILPALFRELCQSSINDDTDDRHLCEVLELACARGRYNYIQEMRACAKTRVDDVLRANAALFLQRLLLNLSPHTELEESNADFRNIHRMDEAIDTVKLLIDLGPSGMLTSSWQLKDGQDDWTALELLKRLLADPENPHLGGLARCDDADKRRYKFHWCLTQRMECSTNSGGNPSITILDQRITWPLEWEVDTESPYYEDQAWVLSWIPSPWSCDCEPPYDPYS
ncbi:uncharacterized protein PG986_012572 [Apiospora aurea]|uniref:Ankyrin repeat protein n=1 Tax=Apiospora aurea TaxID=335848 RepID=A0ABR1Q0C3_9PEZI